METRKLQCVGGGTYTVSIPKGWATDHGLQASTEVHLYTHRDGSIVVRPSHRDEGSLAEATVEVTGDSPDLAERAVRAAYAAGFDAVRLAHAAAFDERQRRRVERIARNLTGTTVEGAGPDELVLRSLLDAADVSLRQTVVQVRFTALSTYRRATEALVDAEAGVAARLAERREEADLLAALLDRQANRSLVSLATVDELGTDRPALADHGEAADLLAGVAADAVAVAAAAEGLDDPLPDPVAAEVRVAVEDARRAIEVATAALLDEARVADANAGLEHAHAAGDRVAALDETLVDGETSLDGCAACIALARALDAVGRTADRAADLASVTLRAATRRDSL